MHHRPSSLGAPEISAIAEASCKARAQSCLRAWGRPAALLARCAQRRRRQVRRRVQVAVDGHCGAGAMAASTTGGDEGS